MKQSDVSRASVDEQLTMLPEYAEYSMSLVKKLEKSNAVCIYSIGQSSIPAEVISAYANECSDIQIPVISDSRIPKWLSKGSDAILISVNENETTLIETYNKLKKTGCRIHCIVSKGKLKEVCEKDGIDLYLVPDNMSSKSAFGFIFGILVSMIEGMCICQIKDGFIKMIPCLKRYRDEIANLKCTDSDYVRIMKDAVCIYGTADIKALYKRYALISNEDFGCLSFCAEIPEFNHNELVGWSMTKTDLKKFSVIILNSKTDKLLSVIVNNMIRTLKEYGRDAIVHDVPGDNVLQKNLCGVIYGDILSLKYKEMKP